MNRPWLTTLLLSSLLLLLASCSNNYKEGEPEFSSADVFVDLNAMAGNSGGNFGTNSSGNSVFAGLIADPQTNVYFSKAPSSMGPVQSLMSFSDFSFFGNGNDANLSPFDISTAKVAFLDGFIDGDHRFLLAVEYQKYDADQPQKFVELDVSHSFGEQAFEAVFETQQFGSILVRSYDLRDGVEDFTSLIQLKVYRLDSSGETYLGKFSTLAGYGAP